MFAAPHFLRRITFLLLLSPGLLPDSAAAVADDLADLRSEYESGDATPQKRLWLIPRIADLGTPAARDFLVERFLDTREPRIRRVLFRELERAFPPLPGKVTRHSLTDPDPYLRHRTLEHLIRESPADMAGRAREILRFDEDPRVRGVAIRFLASQHDPRGLRDLFEICAGLGLRDQEQAITALAALPDSLVRPLVEHPGHQEQPARRLLIALILAERADRNSRKQLTSLAQDDDRMVAFAAALGLDRIGGRGAGVSMKKALKQTRDAEQRCQVLTVIERTGIRDPGLTRALLRELDHPDWRVRAAAAAALGSVGGVHAIEPLVDQVREERIWQVRLACIEALGSTRRAEAIPPLIDALESLTGRLGRAARLALARLTGLDLSGDASAWRRWWREHVDDFEPPTERQAEWLQPDPTADKYAFYGVEIESDRAAFVLDVSGSMQGRKLQVLKVQLGNVIERLPGDSLFNMIFFNAEIRPWKERLEPLTRKNRQAALDAVRYLDADGATNLYGAVMAALADERVDSIYLLSDGQPTAGSIINLAQICDALAEMNRHRRIAFHVILIGYQSEALRRLAADSGGTYVEQE